MTEGRRKRVRAVYIQNGLGRVPENGLLSNYTVLFSNKADVVFHYLARVRFQKSRGATLQKAGFADFTPSLCFQESDLRLST